MHTFRGPALRVDLGVVMVWMEWCATQVTTILTTTPDRHVARHRRPLRALTIARLRSSSHDSIDHERPPLPATRFRPDGWFSSPAATHDSTHPRSLSSRAPARDQGLSPLSACGAGSDCGSAPDDPGSHCPHRGSNRRMRVRRHLGTRRLEESLGLGPDSPHRLARVARGGAGSCAEWRAVHRPGGARAGFDRYGRGPGPCCLTAPGRSTAPADRCRGKNGIAERDVRPSRR